MKGGRFWAWLTIGVAAVATLLSGLSLRAIRIEGGTLFLPPNHPVELRIAAMERRFGSSQIMTVMMRLREGSVFSPATLALVGRITTELEGIPGVREVRSLTNSDYMLGTDGGLVVERLVPRVPVTAAEADLVRQRAHSWELYQRTFFSDDMKATQWIITLAPQVSGGSGSTGTVGAIRRLVAPYEDPSRHFLVSGEVAVKALLVDGITRDLTHLLPILIAILVGILYLAFRRPAGVLLPLATVLMSTVWTVGLMALVGAPINIMGTAIPLLLVTVGSAYGIHFLSTYFAAIQSDSNDEGSGEKGGADPSIAPKLDALRATVRKVGLPILLAGVTTIAGFGSLGSATVPAILQMGLFTALGVLFALLLTFTFVPAVLLLLPARAGNRPRRPAGSSPTLLPGRLFDALSRRPLLVAAALAALVALSGVGVARIQVGQPTVNFFRPSSPIRAASRFADESFGGSTIMYVIIRPEGAAPAGPPSSEPAAGAPALDAAASSGEAGAIFGSFGDLSTLRTAQPEVSGPAESIVAPPLLVAVDGLERELRSSARGGVGNVSSLALMIKQMNKVMHDGAESYYEIPSSPGKYGLSDEAGLRRLIAQYLLLYSGNLGSFVDSTDRPTELRVIVQLTDGRPSFLEKVKRRIEDYGEAHFAPLGYRLETVGLPDEMLAMNDSIMRSQIASVALALVCVLLALWIAYRSLRIGLAALLPIGLSLLLSFATMGFLHIPLDIVTAIIASVAIGIGIDYSIHVVSAYVYEFRRCGDAAAAAHPTLAHTGRAIFFNVASVTIGFAVLIFSLFTPLNSVGILIAVIMVTSSLFALTLLPILLQRLVPHLAARRSSAAVGASPAAAADERRRS